MTFGKILAQVKGAYMWRTCILLIVPVHELPSWQRISKDIILLMSVMLCEVSVCKMQVKRLTFLIYKALLLPGFNYFRFSLRISINRWIKYFRVALVSAFRKPRHRFWQGKSFLGGGRDATCKVFSSSLQQYINIKLHRIVWHPYLIRNNEYSKPRCWDKEERRTSIKKWISLDQATVQPIISLCISTWCRQMLLFAKTWMVDDSSAQSTAFYYVYTIYCNLKLVMFQLLGLNYELLILLRFVLLQRLTTTAIFCSRTFDSKNSEFPPTRFPFSFF